MARGLVRIVMEASGASAVKQALRGTVTEARRADDQLRRGTQDTERRRQQAIRQTTSVATQEARARLRAEREAEREASREAARSRRVREREMRRGLRERQRITGAFGLGGLGAAGLGASAMAAATGVYSAALQASVDRLERITSAVGARAGVRDVGERTAAAQDFELELARGSGEFFQGLSPEDRAREMSALTDEIAAVAVEAGQSPTDLLRVLQTMQTEFSQFEAGRENLRAIALEAQRTGADMEQLARFIGVLNHQLGDTAPTAERAFDVMAQQGLVGAITPEQLATEFGGMFGQFRDLSGLQGEDALRQFGALANALKTKDMGTAETATLMQNLFTALGNSETVSRLRTATGGRSRRVRDPRSGRMRTMATGGTTALREDGTVDFMQLIEDMSTVDRIGTSDVVFHDAQARSAAGQLVALARRARAGEDVATAAQLAGVDASAGSAFRAESLGTVLDTSAVASRRIAVAGELEGISQLGGRAGGANERLAFREAVTQQGLEGLLGAAESIPLIWSWLGQQALPQAASAAAGLSPETRAAIQMITTQMSRTGLPGMELPAAMLAAVTGSGVETLAGLGERTQEIRRSVRLEDGSRVELGDATIDRLASRLSGARSAPVDGRTPGEPRR